MRDLIFIAYIALWSVLAWSGKRVPFWQPCIVRVGQASFIPDQRPAGRMMLLCLAMGAAIGVSLPPTMAETLPGDPYQFRNGGVQDLDGFGRLAKVVGSLCGGYVGFRGSRLWVVLLCLGAAFIALSIVRWVLRGF